MDQKKQAQVKLLFAFAFQPRECAFQSCIPGTAAGVYLVPVILSARVLVLVLFPRKFKNKNRECYTCVALQKDMFILIGNDTLLPPKSSKTVQLSFYICWLLLFNSIAKFRY